MKRIGYIIAGIMLLFITAACGAGAYYILYRPNFTPSETKYVYICEDDKNFARLCEELRDSIGCENIRSFELLAGWRKYPENIKSGRYAVDPGMNNHTLLNQLRRGQQVPVRLTFGNVRLTEDLVEKLSAQLMPAHEDFRSYLDN